MEAQMSAAIALKLVYGEKTAKTAKTAVAPFLRRTWNLIEDNSTDAVITWSSDGKSIVVKKPAALPALLPKRAGILKETYGGFLRELALYGFRCTGHDVAGNPAEFVCEGFERGRPELLARMRRKENYGRARR